MSPQHRLMSHEQKSEKGLNSSLRGGGVVNERRGNGYAMAHPALALRHSWAHEWQRQGDACRHGGMSKAHACGYKAMGAMPWLGCLGKSSNEALSRAGHGLGAAHLTKASLTWEGLVASI